MPIGAAIGGAGVLSAGASIYGANKAANAQTGAANLANSTIQQQYQQNSTNLAPWMQNGANSSGLVNFLTGASSNAPAGYNGSVGGQGALTNLFQPTQAQLAGTPGYQFTLGQGLKSVQNSYAAKGLGNSGAALKGAADYATGDASTTYNQQFQNYLAQNQSIYGMLTGQSQQGLSAAGALTGAGTTAAGQQSGNIIGAGQAQGAAANAAGAAIGNATGGLSQYALLSQFLSNNNPSQVPWGPAYGGGNIFTDPYGGSSQAPLSGLSSSDYGLGY